jgi:hypothetical protein
MKRLGYDMNDPYVSFHHSLSIQTAECSVCVLEPAVPTLRSHLAGRSIVAPARHSKTMVTGPPLRCNLGLLAVNLFLFPWGGGRGGGGGGPCREQDASAINETYSGTAQQALANAISLINTNSWTYIFYFNSHGLYPVACFDSEFLKLWTLLGPWLSPSRDLQSNTTRALIPMHRGGFEPAIPLFTQSRTAEYVPFTPLAMKSVCIVLSTKINETIILPRFIWGTNTDWGCLKTVVNWIFGPKKGENGDNFIMSGFIICHINHISLH